jgi:small subunit ribosomal protein S17
MSDEAKNEKTDETAAEATPEAEETEATAEDTAVEAEAPADVEEAAPEPEPEPEAEPEPEPDPVAEAEEPVAEEPAAEVTEEPAAEVEAAEGAAEAEPAPAQPTAKPKRKRLPRSQRHKHVKPRRERPAQRRSIVRLEKPGHERGRSQERRGVVVSDAMDKTIVVKVDTVKAHRRYKKVVRRSTKFHAHDEQNAAKIGDLVRIVETRPLSKTKNWRLAEVLEEAK